MVVYLLKKYKKHNAGSDVVVTFCEGNDLIKKGIASDKPVTIEKKKTTKKEDK